MYVNWCGNRSVDFTSQLATLDRPGSKLWDSLQPDARLSCRKAKHAEQRRAKQSPSKKKKTRGIRSCTLKDHHVYETPTEAYAIHDSKRKKMNALGLSPGGSVERRRRRHRRRGTSFSTGPRGQTVRRGWGVVRGGRSRHSLWCFRKKNEKPNQPPSGRVFSVVWCSSSLTLFPPPRHHAFLGVPLQWTTHRAGGACCCHGYHKGSFRSAKVIPPAGKSFCAIKLIFKGRVSTQNIVHAGSK